MAKLTIIVGLPGSGKTSLMYEMAKQQPDAWICNEVCRYHGETEYAGVAEILLSGRDAIVNGAELVFTAERQKFARTLALIAPREQVEWIFFENNPKACEPNIRRRNVENVEGQVHYAYTWSKRYFPPKKVIPVYRE